MAFWSPSLARPQGTVRSFSLQKNPQKLKFHVPAVPGRTRIHRQHRTNLWPAMRLNYQFLERCKELVCRVPHPTALYRHRKVEYRIAILPWSQGSYLDIRTYHNGSPTSMGLLLHQDVAEALLPDLVAAIRELGLRDTREPEQKARVTVIPATAEERRER